MSQPWNEWDWDYALHFIGGLVPNGLFVWACTYLGWPWWVPFIGVAALTLFGYGREKMQHFMERLTAHQHLEALLWGVGALVSALVGLAFLF